jgi:hypothetical protein
MSLCPVCNKEFQNIKTHLTRQSKKDDEHKKYLETIENNNQDIQPREQKYKTYSPGDLVSFQGKGQFEVIEDLGEKIVVRRPGSNLFRMTVKKERI